MDRPLGHPGDGSLPLLFDLAEPRDYPERRARDAAQEEAMENLGYMVIRFGHQDDWTTTVAEYPYIFGSEG